jgi:RNA polymerase sigma factor (sigma-70 family)
MTLMLRTKPANRAFEHLYRAHVGDVYRYALAITGNQSDAEDVTQTTFMNAFRALERGEDPAKPRHWLISITHNVCRNRFRQLARRPTEVVYVEDVAETLVPRDDAPTADDIRRALGQLVLNQREALVMRELEGRSYEEIAELLCLSVAAVETLLFRARRALREQLEGSLSCSQAEAALSLQLDGHLDRAEATLLRSHLRACETCRLLARRQRAQRKGVRALALVPVPSGLSSWLGAGSVGAGAAGAAATGIGAGAGAGGGLGAAVVVKIAAATVAAVALGTGGYTIARDAGHHPTAGARPRPTVGTSVKPASLSRQNVEPPRAAAAGATLPGQATHGGAGLAAGLARRQAHGPATPQSHGAPQRSTGKGHASAHGKPAKTGKTKKHAAPLPAGRSDGSRGHAAGAPAVSRACGTHGSSSALDTAATLPTTTDARSDTTATAGSECDQQGRGKGSAKHP